MLGALLIGGFRLGVHPAVRASRAIAWKFRFTRVNVVYDAAVMEDVESVSTVSSTERV